MKHSCVNKQEMTNEHLKNDELPMLIDCHSNMGNLLILKYSNQRLYECWFLNSSNHINLNLLHLNQMFIYTVLFQDCCGNLWKF